MIINIGLNCFCVLAFLRLCRYNEAKLFIQEEIAYVC